MDVPRTHRPAYAPTAMRKVVEAWRSQSEGSPTLAAPSSLFTSLCFSFVGLNPAVSQKLIAEEIQNILVV